MAKRTKIDNWSLRISRYNVIAATDGKEVKIDIHDFERDGMTLLPKQLRTKIQTELRYANLYDKFMDGVFEHVETI